MSKTYKKVELDLGDIEITNVMIDVDGTNLEDGVDVYYEDKFAFNVVGINANRLSENDEEHLNDRLYDFLFK